MPILQEINDPYYAATASTLGGMADGMIGNPAKQQAEAIALAGQVQLRRMQQQKLEQEMADAKTKMGWETTDRQRMDDLATSARRYWEVQPVAPVNGTPEEMERYYRQQDYLGQYGANAARAGKSAEDLGKGLGDLNASVRSLNPAPAPMQSNGMPIPQAPPGMSPEGAKKFNEEAGKAAADQQLDAIASRNAAAKNLPQLLSLRDAYEAANREGGIGPIAGNSWVGRPVGKVFHTDAERARDVYDSQRQQAIASYTAATNKGQGQVSNYERELFAKPFAAVDDLDAQAGRLKMLEQFALTFRTLGVDDTTARAIAAHVTGGAPREAVAHLISDLQRGDTAAAQEWLQSANAGRGIR